MLRWKIIAFAAIALINIIIYYPLLYHIPRADQWCYLADTADYDDLYSLITKFYSYNRVRLFNPGDSFLFRPVMFILLGVEKWAFGHNFFYWQLTGIILHLVLVWFLLKLLLRIHEGVFAYLLAFFFSTLSVIMEMVIWHHINGYILFMIFVLGALYHAYSHVLEGQTKRWRIWVIVAYLTLACFTHELGIIFTVFLALYLLMSYTSSKESLDRKWVLTFLIPLALYFSMNYLDGLAHPHQGIFIPSEIFSAARFRSAIEAFWGATFGWVYAGIFPLMQRVLFTRRLISGMPDCKKLANSYVSINPLDYTGVAAAAVFFSILIIAFATIIRFVGKKKPGYDHPAPEHETASFKNELFFYCF